MRAPDRPPIAGFALVGQPRLEQEGNFVEADMRHVRHHPAIAHPLPVAAPAIVRGHQAACGNAPGKVEYDYLGLNSRTFVVPVGGFFGGDTFTTSNPNVQMVKVGFNYSSIMGWVDTDPREQLCADQHNSATPLISPHRRNIR